MVGGEDDEGERLKLCFVDAEGETVEALPHPRGKPLPLLAPKNGAAEMRKIVRPVLDAVLHHVNKGVEPAMQMSMMDVTTMVLGSRQVRVRVRVRARARARVRVRVRVEPSAASAASAWQRLMLRIMCVALSGAGA